MIHYKNIYACTIISENAVVSCHTAGQPMFLEKRKPGLFTYSETSNLGQIPQTASLLSDSAGLRKPPLLAPSFSALFVFVNDFIIPGQREPAFISISLVAWQTKGVWGWWHHASRSRHHKGSCPSVSPSNAASLLLFFVSFSPVPFLQILLHHPRLIFLLPAPILISAMANEVWKRLLFFPQW